MGHADYFWHFNFEGEFLEFAGKHSDKRKYMRLRLLDEVLQIRLPKELRGMAALFLKPGDRVRVVGLGEVDRASGFFKLKASQVWPVTDCSELPVSTPCSELPTINTTPCEPHRPCAKAKISICQKPGCAKRGGRQLLQALQQTLRDRQLQDLVTVESTGCMKHCSAAPNLKVGKNLYSRVHPDELLPLLNQHLAHQN